MQNMTSETEMIALKMMLLLQLEKFIINPPRGVEKLLKVVEKVIKMLKIALILIINSQNFLKISQIIDF